MATVLHVTQPTDAGVATYLHSLCPDQADRNWRVVVACPDRGRLADDLRAAGIERVPWPAARAPDGRTVSDVVRLRRILDRVGPDVVHLHSSKAGLAGRLAIRGQAPTLFQPHGWSWLAGGRAMGAASLQWERFATRWTTVAICVGEGEAETARRNGVAGPSIVVRSGVDLTRFQPAGPDQRRVARARFGLPSAAPVVVCVGRLSRQKGQDQLLTIWTALRERHPEALLVLVGDGPLARPMRRHAPPGVLFAGACADPRPWYAAADLIVLPSRWEGLPLTLLEALAMARPVVASAIPGIAGELPPGAGALVPPGDLPGLAAAICHRLCDPDMARAEGALGARYAAVTADIRATHEAIAGITAGLAALAYTGVPNSSR
jgi:glycosyltransferase involved in cell wall biosynthesis